MKQSSIPSPLSSEKIKQEIQDHLSRLSLDHRKRQKTI
ncbi:hypothetical protein CWATWH0401_4997 [Crocosphaera watsonii WH 0401]|uniref:Uncharacterized protein n=1 Tax=Crocosphaera watsonii WH 0401 TaxID=555881 RepID=T2J8E3_CROWT|nr:hypothetical protein CWATWH0401_4997 [Crocosphaera watsonii WH 0401]